jgi:hypothetical protein
MNRLLALIVVVIGVVCLGLGVFFLYEGISKNNFLETDLQQEKITLGLTQEQINAGQVVDTSDELQVAADKVKSDRKSIAPTYSDLLGGKHFDPVNPEDLTYAQAMNLENSLNLAILAFGVTQIAMGVGAGLVLVAIALWAIVIVLWRLSGRTAAA